MNILLHRIHSSLKQSKEVKEFNDNFINDINEALISDDIYITEEADIDDMDLVFVESGGAEEAYIKLDKKIKSPFILLSSCKNNSLPACMEIKSYAASNDKEAIIVMGEVNEITAAIKHFSKVYHAKSEISGSRLGVVGRPSDWLIYSKVNYSDVDKKFGISLIDIDMEEFKKEIDKKSYGHVRHLAELQKKWKKKETLEGALYIYGALKRLITRYQLDGLTVRCFDLLKAYKNTACLALALLNEEGYVATCEGDVPSMITMFMLNRLHDDSSFQANPSSINFKDRTVLFAHCTVPFDMVQNYTLDTHFESGLGIGIKGELSLGACTLYKISADLKECVAIDGTIKANENLKDYCRTQATIELPPRSLMDFMGTNVGNHYIISYADEPNTFMALFDLYNTDK